MAINVQFNREYGRLHFVDFPTAVINYTENNPQDEKSFVQQRVIDVLTGQEQPVYLKIKDLRDQGISFQTWSLAASSGPEALSEFLKNAHSIRCMVQEALPVISQHTQFLSLFKDIYFATRFISSIACSNQDRHRGEPGISPPIYVHRGEDWARIFIVLPCKPLGNGTYANVKKVLWLNPPAGSEKIVAVKVSKKEVDKTHLRVEIEALRVFNGQRGIVSVVCAGTYVGEDALFMHCYNYSLLHYVESSGHPFSVDEALSVVSQWLEGLATINQKGIHGDLSLRNLLLRGRGGSIEGVIADFGAYRSYGFEEFGLTTITAAPPEYHREIFIMTAKHDVWGMGLCLYALFSKRLLPFMICQREKEVIDWILPLTPGWIRNWQPTMEHMPDFALNVIEGMLDPRQSDRLTADDALTRFTEGYSDYTQHKAISA